MFKFFFRKKKKPDTILLSKNLLTPGSIRTVIAIMKQVEPSLIITHEDKHEIVLALKRTK